MRFIIYTMHIVSTGMGSTTTYAAIPTRPQNANAPRDLFIVRFVMQAKQLFHHPSYLSFYNADQLQCEKLYYFSRCFHFLILWFRSIRDLPLILVQVSWARSNFKVVQCTTNSSGHDPSLRQALPSTFMRQW